MTDPSGHPIRPAALPILLGWSILSHGVLAAALLGEVALLRALLIWMGLCAVPSVAIAIAFPAMLLADWLRTAPSSGDPTLRHLAVPATSAERRSS